MRSSSSLIKPFASESKRLAVKRLRHEMTLAERILWSALRNRQLGGLKFRRQHLVHGFVVDFYCEECRLVIEVDGAVHLGQLEADRERQLALEAFGLKVLRYSNEQVIEDREQVLDAVASALPHPPGPPLPKRPSAASGEGGV